MNLFLAGTALCTLFIFLIPANRKYLFAAAWVMIVASGSSIVSIHELISGTEIKIAVASTGIIHPMIVIDSLSAFFILTVNFTAITGILYAGGYLRSYRNFKEPSGFSLHYFGMVWLHLSMVLLCMVRDGFSFMLSWELMTLSSFILVMFEANQKNIFKTGINYLIQMHVGMFLLLGGFLVTEASTGIFGFDALKPYFLLHSNIPVFLLFFSGFAIKAGFIPFHTWLPEAHPAAPSHVSGVMSGVMIKMGIYGIFRVILNLHDQLFSIGSLILILSVMTGLFGVIQAIVQHDLKKLLAYHSIENIGIIGIGMGLGVLGLHFQNPALIILGFAGALLHVLNHSLFKSLLFFSVGSVYHATHTRNVDALGGLLKKMPQTGFFFLLAALAICGLPPLNGFISEFLIYGGLYNGLKINSPYINTVILGSIIGLAFIGGLAVFCFTKAFGITFLGTGRSLKTSEAREVETSMLVPKYLIAGLILLIGFVPVIFVKPIVTIVLHSLPIVVKDTITPDLISILWKLTSGTGIFVGILALLLFIRYLSLKRHRVSREPTWGCGYTGMHPGMQYTSTSYTGDYLKIFRPFIQVSKEYTPLFKENIFPRTGTFEQHTSDPIKTGILEKPVNMLLHVFRRLAILQTGKIRHYLLYALLFMVLVLLLTCFDII